MKYAGGALVDWANGAKRRREVPKLERLGAALCGVLRGAPVAADDAKAAGGVPPSPVAPHG